MRKVKEARCGRPHGRVEKVLREKEPPRETPRPRLRGRTHEDLEPRPVRGCAPSPARARHGNGRWVREIARADTLGEVPGAAMAACVPRPVKERARRARRLHAGARHRGYHGGEVLLRSRARWRPSAAVDTVARAESRAGGLPRRRVVRAPRTFSVTESYRILDLPAREHRRRRRRRRRARARRRAPSRHEGRSCSTRRVRLKVGRRDAQGRRHHGILATSKAEGRGGGGRGRRHGLESITSQIRKDGGWRAVTRA